MNSGFSGPAPPFDQFFISVRVNARIRWIHRRPSSCESRGAPLASLFILALSTQVRSLSERLLIEDINRKRLISLYSSTKALRLRQRLYLSYLYQRFVSRRELPTSMYSDNVTTFHRRLRIIQCTKQFAILTSETDSLPMELRGTSYLLHCRSVGSRG